MLDHERRCFLRNGGFGEHQLVMHDLLAAPVTKEALSDIDGIIVGGSGDYSVLDDIPNLDSLRGILRDALKRRLPVLGACFGGQLMATTYGGTVVRDPENQEIGTVTVTRTAAAARDPLFSQLPESFKAQAGHNDRVDRLPRGATLLGSSDKCPVQAFVMRGTPAYAIQFHPELGKQDLLLRLEHYKANYVDDPSEIDAIIAGLEETPESAALVHDWVRTVVLRHSYAA